jgi:hypothetical protein
LPAAAINVTSALDAGVGPHKMMTQSRYVRIDPLKIYDQRENDLDVTQGGFALEAVRIFLAPLR